MNTKFLSLLHSATIDPNYFHIFKSYTEFGFEYLSVPMIEWQASREKEKCKKNLNLYGCTIHLLFESYLKLKKIAKIFKKNKSGWIAEYDLPFIFASFATQY